MRFVCLLSLMLLHGQDAPVLDETVVPVHVEPLTYPVAARVTRAHGAVVVRVHLDNNGKVVSSAAVSGAKSLIPDCISNAKKWAFRPSESKEVIIVYEFTIKGLCQHPCASQFLFTPPNIATVTIGDPIVDHSGAE
jgi:Gram-negative bacterial TonB protein C-terminal